ncbi:hypothetical protein HCU64_14335 [Methylobacterium sp. C25]|uniref:PGN_0703 family putative restriction endonuclease n=1 Tax=Methylobacterium sp. C25 TaxID=2721622 RepID=UPI001F249CA0|nr:hypothetical protein [Methylobacterium sp. C25]MCE4224937.1 hypothetical protein [Methylobacterium sp. C25]
MDKQPSPNDNPAASRVAQPLARAPLVPEPLLRRHSCWIFGDTRFRAAARFRQSLWREEQGLPAGLHQPDSNKGLSSITLGSKLQTADGDRGVNFISQAVHASVRHSLIMREEGACVNYERLHRNLLSSEPLNYNLFVPLLFNLDLATAVFRQILPDFVHQVTDIRFETSPGRHEVRYLRDGTAFDTAVSVVTPDGESATVFIEVKYSEGCSGPAATRRPRYDEVSREVALHHNSDALALRSVQFEQFWRLHLLAQLAVRTGVTPRAHLLVLSPRLNRRVAIATALYAAELVDPVGSSPETVGFTSLSLESFVDALAQAGGGAEASYLRHRYLDLQPVLDLVLEEAGLTERGPSPAESRQIGAPTLSALAEGSTRTSNSSVEPRRPKLGSTLLSAAQSSTATANADGPKRPRKAGVSIRTRTQKSASPSPALGVQEVR